MDRRSGASVHSAAPPAPSVRTTWRTPARSSVAMSGAMPASSAASGPPLPAATDAAAAGPCWAPLEQQQVQLPALLLQVQLPGLQLVQLHCAAHPGRCRCFGPPCWRTAAAMAASSCLLGEMKVSRLSRAVARVDLGADTGSNQTGTPAAAACRHASCRQQAAVVDYSQPDTQPQQQVPISRLSQPEAPQPSPPPGRQAPGCRRA